MKKIILTAVAASMCLLAGNVFARDGAPTLMKVMVDNPASRFQPRIPNRGMMKLGATREVVLRRTIAARRSKGRAPLKVERSLKAVHTQ